MELVVGGFGQGKRSYVLETHHLLAEELADGGTCAFELPPEIRGVNRLHLLVRRLVEEGRDPLVWAEDCAANHPKLILISNEIGCGVVPLTPEERVWREAAGRVCCYFAREAAVVTRLCCGLPMTLKAEKTEDTLCKSP